MSVVSEPAVETGQTIADLLRQLGDIPPDRVLLHPPPGTATEEDVIRAEAARHRLFELVDGALVEKAMGFCESFVAATIVRLMGNFVEAQDSGIVVGPDGTIRLLAGLVRIPDAAYVSWDRLGGRVPRKPLASVIPELAVEVLSVSNTRGEMARKRREYFQAGVRLVWEIDPAARTATVYTQNDAGILLHESDSLGGGDVLPGLTIPLRRLFAKLED